MEQGCGEDQSQVLGELQNPLNKIRLGSRGLKGPETSSLVAQLVKNMSAMQETQVLSLGQEDPPEEGMATHSSILAWEIPWTEEAGGLPSMGSQRVRHD